MATLLPVDDLEELKLVLVPVMKGIAAAFGPRCELVLHDLRSNRPLGSTIVHIENGHVTGRSVGGPITSLGLQLLRSDKPPADMFNYKTRTEDGRTLRSSSIFYNDRNRRLIAALCVNVDVMPLIHLRQALDDVLDVEESEEVDETFGSEVGSVLDVMVRDAVKKVGKPVSFMTKGDKVVVLGYLDERGAFLVKRAVDRIASALNVSRVTAYAYLQESRNRNGDRPDKAAASRSRL